jgi:glycosyltransferase involved in cell wall biosynthesis
VEFQDVKPKLHYYIDDGSTDDTRKYLSDNLDKFPSNTKVVFSDNRNFKLKNLYDFVQVLNDDDIVCVLDGDDWLYHSGVLSKIVKEYENPNVDYVYTNWLYSHNNEIGISKPIPESSWDPYQGQWITSAMSTFRVRAFNSINKENFLRWDGEWFTMACDQAYVLPILWNLKKRDGDYSAVRFINEPLYVYQFAENPSKLRYGIDNSERAKDAHDSSTFIRQRGYVDISDRG